MPARRPPTAQFEVWKAGARVVSIDNPVRLRILGALEEGPKTLNHLVALTRKTKPTLSTIHIPPLEQAGLVVEAADPKDARVKWYTLVGQRIGSSALDPSSLRDAVLGYVQSSGFVPLRPLLAVLDPASLVETAGKAYVDGVVDRLGRLLGRMLFAKTEADARRELAGLLDGAALAQGDGRPKGALARFRESLLRAALDEWRRARK